MAQIGILVHEHDNFPNGTYFLRYIAEVWREMGLEVHVYQGLQQAREAELVFLHVDLTVIPLDYLGYARKLPRAINTTTGDISKSKISPNVLKRSDLFGGRVIIKTDNNCGGYKEANLAATTSLNGRMRRLIDDKLPWRMFARTIYTYPILKSTSKVPHAVWNNPNLVVEKFRPEKKDGLYCLRTWVFLGEQETHSICYSKEPVVKSDNVIRREELSEVPNELRRIRQKLGFEFGKFDYAINMGEMVLYDVNHTPTLGKFPSKKFMPGIRRLAEGIFALLPNSKPVRSERPIPNEQTESDVPPASEVSPEPDGQPALDTQSESIIQSEPDVQPASDLPSAPKAQVTPDVQPSPDGHWSKITTHWKLIGPPLRPCQEDLAFVTGEVQKLVAPQALILGVTPELYQLSWPIGTELSAIDNTQDMIDALWPGPAANAYCGEWTSLPFADGSKNVVVCDGGFHLLSYPNDQRALVEELHRVLSPEGLCLIRLFVPPPRKEDTISVIADLVQGKIPSLNILKLRLAMAMQDSAQDGIGLNDIWQKLHSAAGPWKSLASLINWPLHHLEAIDSYKDSPNRYYFVDTTQVREMFGANPGGFEHVISHVPIYPLGDCCPTVVFRKA